jgi:antirestriction protein ArdC
MTQRLFGPGSKSLTERRDPGSRPGQALHAELTQKIVAQIEAGAGEFKMPWHRPGVAFTLPKNALTEATYRGSNILWLWMAADEKKFEHPVYATYKQWHELGGQVRGGEKGTTIVKVGEWVPNSAADPKPDSNDFDDTAKRLYAKPATVFNIDQVDMPPELRARLVPDNEPRPDFTVRLAHADAYIAATGAEFREGGQRAFYRHRLENGGGDFIQMPPRDLFTGTETSTPTESFESTRLHELTHWVGASHRLNRTYGERFGDRAYAFEELVAELGAAFLCAELGITNVPRPDHAQYISGWLAVLTNDTRAIFTAAAAASTAVAYLNGLQPPETAPTLPNPASTTATNHVRASDDPS